MYKRQFLPRNANARRALEADFESANRAAFNNGGPLPQDEPVPQEISKKNQKWKPMKTKNVKYVDDNLQIDKICMETAAQVGGVRDKYAVQCQNLFRRVTGRAEGRGMKVNTAKTGMLCINDAMSYKAEAHILSEGGERIESGDTLKVLGFNLSRKFGVHVHVESLRKKFRSRYWCIYHLRRAEFTPEELAKVYRTILLPLADYCSVVYLSLIHI